jgi:DNA-binding transcriptional LysR family regulator
MRYLRLFEYINAIVTAGSIRRAAEQLFITPSALDRRVQQLEKELDAPLFERHPRGMRLTAAGEIFLGYVRRHLSEIERVRSEIDGLQGLRHGQVDLVVSQALALHFLPEQIRKFSTQFPGVTFSVRVVDHHEAERALLAFEADLAIVVAPKMNSEILAINLLSQPLVAMMSIAHPLARESRVRLFDCLNYPLILPDRTLSSRTLLDPLLSRRSIPLQIRMETNSFELMRGLLQDHLSIAFQIEIGAPALGADPHVTYRPLDARDARSAPLVCAQLHARTLSVAAARFADQISEVFNSLQPAFDSSAS